MSPFWNAKMATHDEFPLCYTTLAKLMCGLCQRNLTHGDEVVNGMRTADLASLVGPIHVEAQRRHPEQYALVVRPSIVSLVARLTESAAALRLIDVALPRDDGDGNVRVPPNMRWRLAITSTESGIWWLKAMAMHPIDRPMTGHSLHAIFSLSLESLEGSLDMSWTEARLLARSGSSEEREAGEGLPGLIPQELIWKGREEGGVQAPEDDDDDDDEAEEEEEEAQQSRSRLMDRLEGIQRRVISQLERVALIDSRLRQVTLAPYDDMDVNPPQARPQAQGESGRRRGQQQRQAHDEDEDNHNHNHNRVEVVIDTLLDALSATVENAEMWTREWLEVMRQGT